MKKILFIILITTIFGCDLRGWFPGWDDNTTTSTKQPIQGCNNDININYKNNCSKALLLYFIEINPRVTFNCESLSSYGTIGADQIKTVTIHKGKLGYFVFAEDTEGKCTSGHRKSEAWVNCEQSTSSEVSFNVCQ